MGTATGVHILNPPPALLPTFGVKSRTPVSPQGIKDILEKQSKNAHKKRRPKLSFTDYFDVARAKAPSDEGAVSEAD